MLRREFNVLNVFERGRQEWHANIARRQELYHEDHPTKCGSCMHGAVRPVKSKFQPFPSLCYAPFGEITRFFWIKVLGVSGRRFPEHRLEVPIGAAVLVIGCVHFITEHPTRRPCVFRTVYVASNKPHTRHTRHTRHQETKSQNVTGQTVLVLMAFQGRPHSTQPHADGPIVRGSTSQQTWCHGQLHTWVPINSTRSPYTAGPNADGARP